MSASASLPCCSTASSCFLATAISSWCERSDGEMVLIEPRERRASRVLERIPGQPYTHPRAPSFRGGTGLDRGQRDGVPGLQNAPLAAWREEPHLALGHRHAEPDPVAPREVELGANHAHLVRPGNEAIAGVLVVHDADVQ